MSCFIYEVLLPRSNPWMCVLKNAMYVSQQYLYDYMTLSSGTNKFSNSAYSRDSPNGFSPQTDESLQMETVSREKQ
jgi:hypothetical protein